jgi:hypothetical protein
MTEDEIAGESGGMVPAWCVGLVLSGTGVIYGGARSEQSRGLVRALSVDQPRFIAGARHR